MTWKGWHQFTDGFQQVVEWPFQEQSKIFQIAAGGLINSAHQAADVGTQEIGKLIKDLELPLTLGVIAVVVVMVLK